MHFVFVILFSRYVPYPREFVLLSLNFSYHGVELYPSHVLRRVVVVDNMWIRVRDRFMNSASRPVRFEFGTPATMTIIVLPPRTERFTFVRENSINKLKLTTTRIYTYTYRVVHSTWDNRLLFGKNVWFFQKNFFLLFTCLYLVFTHNSNADIWIF